MREPTARRRFPAGSLTPDGGRQYRVPEVVTLDLLVSKGGSDYRLSGRIEGGLELDCSRCLEPFRPGGFGAIGLRLDAGGVQDGRRRASRYSPARATPRRARYASLIPR